MKKLFVCAAFVAMCWAVPAQAFFDNMEYADQAAAQAVWPADALVPSASPLQLTSAVNHTPGGSKALTQGLYGTAYQESSHSFGAGMSNGSATVWYYDAGVGPMDHYQTSLIDFRSADYSQYNCFGTNRDTGVSEEYYFFYNSQFGWQTVFQGPERSQGWHEITMTFSDTGGALYFDGMQLIGNTGFTNLGIIRMGSGHWDGETPGFAYDDVTVTPEPCTMLVLGIGGLLALRGRK